MNLTLTPAAGADLALFMVSDCTVPSSCVAWADAIGPGAVTQLSPGVLSAGSYFVYVDSYHGDGPASCGGFTLQVTGQASGAGPELLGFEVE